MSLVLSRRLFLLLLLLLTASGCKSTPSPSGELIVGAIHYDRGQQIINRYANFDRYLGEKTGARIQLEPAFNENKAIERIENRAWSLVFAPPGIAALAIAHYQYQPLFPLQGISNLRSILVVRKDSSIHNLKELEGKTVALGQPGSATGYYLPIYNLHGLTLAEIVFAPTPKAVLEAVAQKKAAAGAVSMEEFNLYTPQLNPIEFRVLYTDPHNVPPGVVLIGPNVERNQEERIRKIMSEIPSGMAGEVGYIPNASVPDYQYMISVVEKVRPVAAHLQQKPVRLF
jgi:phosphonate transport system substrate-binding protein